MQTRQVDSLWPFSKSVQIDFHIVGKLPPTTEDILVKFKSLHLSNLALPENRNHNSKLKDAAYKICYEAQQWWINAGYVVRRIDDLSNEVLKLNIEWKEIIKDNNKIKKGSKKSTPGIERNVESFLKKAQKTFHVVPESYAKYLEASAESTVDMNAKRKFETDLIYLRNMYAFVGDEREGKGSLGRFDRELASSSVSSPKPKANRDTSTTKSKPTSSTDPSNESTQSPLDSIGFLGESSDSDTVDSSDPDYAPPVPLKKKKSTHMQLNFDKQALKSACLQSDVDGESIRHQLKYTTNLIQSAGGSTDNISLSRSSLDRFKKQARHEKVGDIQDRENGLLQKHKRWVLLWDGKTFKQRTHAGKKKPVLAILLKCLDNDEEILVDVIDMTGKKGGSDLECSSIVDSLNYIEFDVKKIIGLVFDTTAVNSGHLNGVAVQLQQHISHQLLQLACRHHVMELVCGGAASIVYGDSESPYEAVFKSFASVWENINVQDYRTLGTSNRKLCAAQEEIAEFLLHWLQHSPNLREDYKKLIELTILFLGATFPTGYNFSFKAPGAFHHARWMAKIIYTISIAMFKHQLADDPEFTEACDLDLIWSLAAFLCLHYVKFWFMSPNLADAAVNDLQLWNKLNDVSQLSDQQLKNYPIAFKDMAEAALQKLNLHLWYLTERHVVFAFASEQVPMQTKVKMWQKMQRYKSSKAPAAVTGSGLVQMPAIKKTTRLQDLIGPDSHRFFRILPEFEVLLSCHPKEWPELQEYQSLKSLLKKMPATNDSCERALGMVTAIEKRVTTPTTNTELANVIKVTHAYRAAIRNAAKNIIASGKKADTTTKQFLQNIRW